MSKFLAGGKLAGGNPERGRVDNDFYATDPKSTRALLDNVEFYGNSFLEPCCGQGHISKVIEEYYPDAEIVSQDLVDRGYPNVIVQDFLIAVICEFKESTAFNVIADNVSIRSA